MRGTSDSARPSTSTLFFALFLCDAPLCACRSGVGAPGVCCKKSQMGLARACNVDVALIVDGGLYVHVIYNDDRARNVLVIVLVAMWPWSIPFWA